MVEIPVGKALIAVEGSTPYCDGCDFVQDHEDDTDGCVGMCDAHSRKDGKNIVYKLVDMPEKKDEAPADR
jgi:hypothetical protein